MSERERLTRRDWLFIAVCLLLAAASIAIIARSYHAAFPEASIDFRYDRNTSRAIAEKLIAGRLDEKSMKHAARFDADHYARIFLERSLGLDRANRVMSSEVRVWYWHHRWFKPLSEEELSVDVAPTGEIVSFAHKVPEDADVGPGFSRAGRAEAHPHIEFLRAIGVRIDDLKLISTSERQLPKRIQRIYTWESQSIRPAGAPYRHTVIVDGTLVTGYSQRLKVPDAWMRSYRDLRAKNAAAGAVDYMLFGAIGLAAIVIFVVRLRRGDLHLRFLMAVGAVSIVLSIGVALNSFPAQLADYDTTTSYAAFLGSAAFWTIVSALGTAMFLIVVCGSGEILYRERLPKHLAMPRLWNRNAIQSRRVFLALILGYSLVPIFIAYQTVFYLTAQKFGAWAPAEVPYDDMLDTALPWMAVLFAGFFPAMSEEFLSRAFSIPFLQRLIRSRLFAIVLAGFIWGFGHSTYPNQPFYIRGVEVGIVGVVAGLLMDRFGLLPLLIWHYTVDAVYTATILFASGNTYYVASAAVASLIFAVPLLAAIFFYLRNRGFARDDELSNETLPVKPAPPHPEVDVAAAQFPPPVLVTRKRVAICIAVLIAAIVALALRPPSVDDVVDYRITAQQAKEIAEEHLRSGAAGSQPAVAPRRAESPPLHIIAAPVEGFRSWDGESPREDGGAPGGFDSTAATYLVQNGMSIDELTRVFRERIEAATWTVRFFSPMKKEEIFVEVDPRTSRAIGYHKYQDEQNPGPSLSQAAALQLARGAFARYAIDPNAFDVKEALSFQQPKRRDWLFHFEERTPIAAQAYRRISVRVAGAEVTQFNKHVKVPESVHRDASQQTAVHILLFILKIVGVVALLGLAIAGLIVVTRAHGLPWRRALRWTAMLAIIPIASSAARYEQMLFAYNTSTAWETFRIRMLTDFATDVGMQIVLLFVAIAGLEAAVPYALSLVRNEGRARFGRAAVIAALTTVGAHAAVQGVLQWIDRAWPSAADIGLAVSDIVAIPFPALFDGSQAIFAAIVISAAVALYASAAGNRIALITVPALFCAMLNPGATMQQIPLMLVHALVSAALAWILARYVLGANPLAWPLTIFFALTLKTATVLLQNQRIDLIVNGVALLAFAAAAMVWQTVRRWNAWTSTTTESSPSLPEPSIDSSKSATLTSSDASEPTGTEPG